MGSRYYNKTGRTRQRPRDPNTKAHTAQVFPKEFKDDLLEICTNIVASKEVVTVAIKDIALYLRRKHREPCVNSYSISKFIKYNFAQQHMIYRSKQFKIGKDFLVFLVNTSNIQFLLDRKSLISRRKHPTAFLPDEEQQEIEIISPPEKPKTFRDRLNDKLKEDIYPVVVYLENSNKQAFVSLNQLCNFLNKRDGVNITTGRANRISSFIRKEHSSLFISEQRWSGIENKKVKYISNVKDEHYSAKEILKHVKNPEEIYNETT